jgi:peptidoglycan/xylan/chitin deacetylase (PgdA/CDA1 family)
MAVTPRHFTEQLEILRKHVRPMSLPQLSQALLEGKLPDRSVVVTFDDGYADNLYNAKPALERYEIPATVFVTTGYVGRNREFWWDQLERLLLQPSTLPETLFLHIDGNKYHWELGKAVHYSEDYSRNRRWRIWKDASDRRHSLYYSLWELLHPLRDGEREKILDELLTWAAVEPAPRPAHRPLSLGEVSTLAQGELIEVGSHTVTHPALSILPKGSQRHEILTSKVRLEEILGGRSVTSFSYPHGSLSADTVDVVREAAFACACSSFADVVSGSSDPFQLPRVQVQDWNGKQFAKLLSRWLQS